MVTREMLWEVKAAGEIYTTTPIEYHMRNKTQSMGKERFYLHIQIYIYTFTNISVKFLMQMMKNKKNNSVNQMQYKSRPL